MIANEFYDGWQIASPWELSVTYWRHMKPFKFYKSRFLNFDYLQQVNGEIILAWITISYKTQYVLIFAAAAQLSNVTASEKIHFYFLAFYQRETTFGLYAFLYTALRKTGLRTKEIVPLVSEYLSSYWQNRLNNLTELPFLQMYPFRWM